MVRNLPESETPDVREYIYVDTDRVRSLLAQMSDGLPDVMATSSSRASRLRLGMSRIGIDTGRETSESEKLSLADLHVSLLEEAATSLGLLSDVSDRARREKFWLRGNVRSQLEPGMFLRLTAPTQLVDPNSIMNTLREFQAAMGDVDETIGQFLQMVGVLYGSAIALSIRPTSELAARSAFVGTIPLDHAFSPMVRDLLLSRIGPDPVQMTSLIQVARIPTEHDNEATAKEQISGLTDRLVGMSDNRLDRGVLDVLISQVGGMLEQYGIAAAPKWPAISVVPLALYRNVLPVPVLDADEDAATE